MTYVIKRSVKALPGHWTPPDYGLEYSATFFFTKTVLLSQKICTGKRTLFLFAIKVRVVLRTTVSIIIASSSEINRGRQK